MSDLILPGTTTTGEIDVSETIGKVTGAVQYKLRGDHVSGTITFFPTWYPEFESSPEDFLIASGDRNFHVWHSSPGRAFEDLHIRGENVEFFYVGTREDPPPPRPRHKELENCVGLTYSWAGRKLPRDIDDDAIAIIKQLIAVSLERSDAPELRRMSDLAAAATRHERELQYLDELRTLVEDYTRELAESQQRAAVFASQAETYRPIYDQYEQAWKEATQRRRAEYRRTSTPKPSPPAGLSTPVQPPRTNHGHRPKA